MHAPQNVKLENYSIAFLQTVENQLPSDPASLPTRPKSSTVSNIQDVSWEIINILGGDIIGYCEKKNCWNIVCFWRLAEIQISKSPDSFSVCWVGWNIARVLDSASPSEESKDPLRRTTRDLRSCVAKCVEVDGGILEHLLWTTTILSC